MTDQNSPTDRYRRQRVLPEIGAAGQARLAGARVLLVGCGALGSHLAELLVRAGVGFIRLVDRDLVEWSNLQRQVLFDEKDAAGQLPKAVAAAGRLREVNSTVIVEPVVADVNAGNIEGLVHVPPLPMYSGGEGQGEGRSSAAENSSLGPNRERQLPVESSPSPPALSSEYDSTELAQVWGEGVEPARAGLQFVELILDGTDNVSTRYLLNDVAVKHGIPWIYGACVGTGGRVMAVWPGRTACLRCVFPDAPPANELDTCDTAGVLGPAAAAVAAIQAAAALRLLVEGEAFLTGNPGLIALDVWNWQSRAMESARNPQPDCPCCQRRVFPFLEARDGDFTTSLCGRNTVQVQNAGARRMQLDEAVERLGTAGIIQKTPYFVRCQLHEPRGIALTLFPDGRLLVHGMTDLPRAKAIYARFVGS